MRQLNGVISISGKQGPRGLEGKPRDYTTLVKVEDYLYEAIYNDIDYNYANNYFKSKKPIPPLGSCSSFIKDGKFCRAYDWTYDDNVEIIVKTPARDGKYAVNGISASLNITEDLINTMEYTELYKLLPFYIVDGMNEKGLTISTNVVPLDKGMTIGTEPLIERKDEVCSIMLIRYLLEHATTAQEAVEMVRDYLSVYVPTGLHKMGYEQHYLIYDGTKAYVLEFVENAPVIIEADAITNFFLADTTFIDTVYTPASGFAPSSQGITAYGSGLERYNLIKTSNATPEQLLIDLSYTNSYKRSTEPFWYTEFVGGDLTVDSTPQEFEPRVNKYIEVFNKRTRHDVNKTWQSTHSIIYDLSKKTFKIRVQEGDFLETDFSFTNSIIAGVSTWNTRQGEVLPEYGDYNLSMVGAELLTNTDIDELWRDN